MEYNLEHEVIRSVAQPTSHIGDRHKCLAALAYAKSRGISRKVAEHIILEGRMAWLDWLAITQRKWQCHTKNANKARHTDSISLREQYVRC